MKTPRSFSSKRFSSAVRFASAGTLLFAAAALAFVAVKPSASLLGTNSNSNKQAIAKFAEDREDLFRNKRALPGPERDGGPLLAAEIEYANRAYPAKDIPFSAILNATTAWTNVRARGAGRGPNAPTSAWTLVGPSTANFPDILTFSGAAYTTSGRITALAVDPSCSVRKCRVWAGAAGGGVWRTDNALSGSGVNWTFVSGSFGTNAIGTLTYTGGVLYAGTGEANASGDSAAGVGIYKSVDGGNTWSLLSSTVGPITTVSPAETGVVVANGTYTGNAFLGRSISSIVVDPTDAAHLY